jgi:carboxyl-terminal processing protease
MPRNLLVALAFATQALVTQAFTAAAATAQNPAANVKTILSQADAASVDRTFEFGLQIADLADDKQTDPVRDAIVAGVQDLGTKARIAAAVALQSLRADTTYGRDVLAMLEPVAKSEDAAQRGAAMALLGEERVFNTRIQPDVRKLLLANAEDELVPPLVRIEAALALWRIGTSGDRGVAKSTLEQFLRSMDRDLQIRGALALAELNVATGAAWGLLRDVQVEPTDLGRRARLYVERERERREFESLMTRMMPQNGEGISSDDEYGILTEIRRRIHASHVNGSKLEDAELIEYAAKGMLMGLDPHSTFFTSQEFQKFFFDLNREYGGIGAFVNFDQDNDFSVIRPIYSGPAYKAGMKSGDKILEVDGWETAGHTTDEIISRLKGKPGTDVELKVFRSGWQEPELLTIERRQISVPSVNHTMLPGKIGYLELVTFGSHTGEELDRALRDVMQQGAVGIVLDVRNNTGGFLSQAREVVERFVDGRKLVVYTEGPSEPRRDYFTRNRQQCSLPLVVLTNNYSASASEILAGAMQDLGRATIIGERTFGKGTVQNMMGLASDPREPFEDLNDDGIWQEGEDYSDRNGNGRYDVGAHIKLTVAKYYLPSGRCTHREFDKEGKIVDPDWGVRPDLELEMLDKNPEDAWKNSAVFALLKKNVFREYVQERMAEHADLFRELAEGDGGDTSRYPGFDDFYDGLETKLSKDDIRRWIRYEVRDHVSDLRGAVYPGQRAMGDPQEDAQLQAGMHTLLRESGRDIRQVEELVSVLKFDPDKPGKADK